jgi:hypothetical protein
MKRSNLCTTSDTDCPSSNPRKQYRDKVRCDRKCNSNASSKQPWTTWEHERYLRGVAACGTNWKEVAKYIKTKGPTQVKSHHQRVTKKEKDRSSGQRQAIIYKYVEANTDLASAQMEKAVNSTSLTDTREIFMTNDLFEYMVLKSSIGLSETAPVALEIAIYTAAELIRDDVCLPIKPEVSSQLLAKESNFVGVSEATATKLGNKHTLPPKVKDSLDTFNHFGKAEQRYKFSAEHGADSC